MIDSHTFFKDLIASVSLGVIIAVSGIASLSYSNGVSANNPFKGAASTAQEDQFRETFDAWMLRAYEGDRDAQFKVALMFSDGTGTTKDIEQAVYWYIQASRQGLASAQYNLGHKYLNGEGTSKDPAKAVNWWRKAAEQDHELAQFNVARAYYSGIGVDKDETRAKYWFQRAAANEEPRSSRILADVFNVPASQIGIAVSNVEPSANTVIASQTTPIQESDPSTYTVVSSTETMEAPTAAPVYESETTVQTDVVAVSDRVITSTSEPYTLPSEPVEIVEDISSTTEIISESYESSESLESNVDTNTDISIYNKPNIRSFVVTSDLASNLKVISRTKDWSKVSSQQGFPVWVYNSFVKIENGIATIVGDNVNARISPKIVKGSVVGQFFNNDQLAVIEEVDKWTRVQSLPKFTAWVKNSDLVAAINGKASSTIAQKIASKAKVIPTPKVATVIETKPDVVARKINSEIKTTDSYAFKNDTNDNKWLFSLPPEKYTLQLASFSEDSVFNNYVKRKKLGNDSNMRQFISNRNNIEWKYILYGNYDSAEEAKAVMADKNFKKAWVRQVGKIRKNRCVAWKTTIPTPPELKVYCQ